MGRKASIQRRKAREEERAEKAHKKKQRFGAKHLPIVGQPVPIENPTRNDILLGRGGPIVKHNRNTPYNAIIVLARPVYNSLDEGEDKAAGNKRKLAEDINLQWVQQLDPPGKFLEKGGVDDRWYEVLDEKKIRDRTMTALRNKNREKLDFEKEIEATEEQMLFLQPYMKAVATSATTVPVNQNPSFLSRELLAAQQLGTGFSSTIANIPYEGMFPSRGMFGGQAQGSNIHGWAGISHTSFPTQPSASPTYLGRDTSGTSSDWYGRNSCNHVDADSPDALKGENLALKVELVTMSNFVEQFQKQNMANVSGFAILQKQLQQCSSQTGKIAELEKAVEKLNERDKHQTARIEKLHHELAIRKLLDSDTDWKAAV